VSDLAARLAGRRVVIAGDVMVDRFLFGRVDRISPEAPVPVLRFEREERRLGGAANVAANVRALGGHPVLAGVVGRDEWGRLLREDLEAAGIEASLIVDDRRPTTCKVRLATSRNQQVARIDYESDADIDAAAADGILDACRRALDAAGGAGALVISDYRKGAVTGGVYAGLVAAARERGVPVVADPKTPDMPRYRGATVITPNHHEAEAMARIRIRTDDDARRAARAIRDEAGVDSVVITRGEHGMWVLDASGERGLPAAAREVADVTGAGDTVVAALALGLASGLSLVDAAGLANRAAAVVVTKFGAATVTLHEIR
jgi:D-beta-D-heptose 7-phosphate kinase/D-beta-D-heptose 1-phosphate adenosyltransferase